MMASVAVGMPKNGSSGEHSHGDETRAVEEGDS